MSVLKVLGFLNVFPATLLNAVWIVPLVLMKQFRRFKKRTEFSIYLIPLSVVPDSFLDKRLQKYAGCAIGAFILIREDSVSEDYLARTLIHEETHVLQQYYYGIFMPVIYVICSIAIFIFYPNKHSYYDNPFERQARKRAGQTVDIPRENWNNPEDRWLWW